LQEKPLAIHQAGTPSRPRLGKKAFPKRSRNRVLKETQFCMKETGTVPSIRVGVSIAGKVEYKSGYFAPGHGTVPSYPVNHFEIEWLW